MEMGSITDGNIARPKKKSGPKEMLVDRVWIGLRVAFFVLAGSLGLCLAALAVTFLIERVIPWGIELAVRSTIAAAQYSKAMAYESGYLSRERPMAISGIDEDWRTGEYRDCESSGPPYIVDTSFGNASVQDTQDWLSCRGRGFGDEEKASTRKMRVGFSGSLVAPEDGKPYRFQCLRKPDIVECSVIAPYP